MFNKNNVRDTKVNVGALVKLLRDRKSLTQEQLAEQLGLSRLTIQNLEAGKNPTMDTLLKVLQHFDLLPGFDRYIESEMNNNSQQSLY